MARVRLWHWVNAAQQAQRGHLLPWSPVCLGLGFALYFALPWEPAAGHYAAALAVAAVAGLAGWRWREAAGPLATAVVLVATGLCLAGARAHSVAGPVLGFRYYGPIEGRIVAVDRSASDRLRLTLDQVVLARTDPARVPRRVRISLHGEQGHFVPEPGALVAMTGHLSAPEGPGEPGGFDFQRHAWFLGIGAVGYTRTPALLLAPRPPGQMRLAHLRTQLSQAIRARIGGDAGAFAAAVLTGDRSEMPMATMQALRDSNIAHLLAISGLHMGLLTGFVFLCLRAGVALISPLALRVPSKKIAAVGALAAGAFYLALSGGNVATERAFIQIAVMFVAVLLDRRAVTLRSVAIAAMIVLAHRPETLLGPGFQMSFAATTALVAVFNALKHVEALKDRPRWMRAVLGVVLSSVVAGLATAPFAAAQFNRLAVYGLVANLLTVPVMGSFVIPAAVVALLMWPVGLEGIGFAVMTRGIDWILAVARHVAAMPGALHHVVMPPGTVMPLLTLGALVVILWQGRGRWAGVLPCLIALALWTMPTRPDLLISPSGRLAGVMDSDGRGLSRARGDGFVAGLWLENDGDAADQAAAAARAAWQQDGSGQVATLGDWTVWHGVGRRAARDLARACAAHDVIVTPEEEGDLMGQAQVPNPLPRGAAAAQVTAGGCTVIGPGVLARTGAIALILGPQGVTIRTARAEQGTRLWVQGER